VSAVASQLTLQDTLPLAEVTFCVVDLETTGGSPSESRITEIGAVKMRGGQRLGTFATLVNPGIPIPRFIAHLTGIDDLEVSGAPSIEWVLPSFAEFARGCVFVAHNARFDFTFLNVALERLDYEPFPAPPVCTARLARRIVWPEVPNVRLATLARYFRTTAEPIHRALPDAETCAQVLHGLLELGGRLGIVTIGDVHQAVRARGRPNFGKIRLADGLPSAPGVYLFRARDGSVLYVGKARDLRGRVKRYFYGDERKQVEDLLAHAVSVDGVPCGGELEALVREARLIVRHDPPYNRRGKGWRRYAYLKLDLAEAFPRLKVVRRVSGPGEYLGPFRSARLAHLVKEAIEEVFPIRRCTRAMRPATRFPPCALAEIGRCLSPCDGRSDLERYGELVRALRSSLSTPGGLLEALEARMRGLAGAERFEEAADVRDRLRALAEQLARGRSDRWLLSSGRFAVRDLEGRTTVLRAGSLDGDADAGPIPSPCPRERADELAAVRTWLARTAVALVDAEHPPAEPVSGGRVLHDLLAQLRAHDRASGRDH
jgi:DNA polymerase III subunit epsilon